MSIEIRRATTEDLPVVSYVEGATWGNVKGENMVAPDSDLLYYLQQDLMFISFIDGKPAGIASYYKPPWMNNINVEGIKEFHDWQEFCTKYNFPKGWHAATNSGSFRDHDPKQKYGLLVSVSVLPEKRGIATSQLMNYVYEEVAKCETSGLFAYGRLRGLKNTFSTKPTVAEVTEYTRGKKEGTDLPVDPSMRFFARNKGKVLGIIPDSMPDDEECYGYGILTYCDLTKNGQVLN